MTKYQRKRETVEAREVKDDQETVVTSEGSYTARKGDYIVTMGDGDHVVPRDEFLETYEKSGKKGAKKSTAKKAAKKST